MGGRVGGYEDTVCPDLTWQMGYRENRGPEQAWPSLRYRLNVLGWGNRVRARS